MTRAAALVLVLALAPVSCAATTLSPTIRFTATMPTTGATGSCDSLVESPLPNLPFWCHWQWAGVSGGRLLPIRRDSTLVMPGQVVQRIIEVAAGTYDITVWTANSSGPSCVKTMADTALVRPAPVTLKP